MRLSLCATAVALFWGRQGGNVTFCTKMYLLIKDTLFQLWLASSLASLFFANRKTTYSAVVGDKPYEYDNTLKETGTKSAFAKRTFY
ncbi:hypothetical protein FFI16_021105 [Pseudomonas sp. KBS0710]|uniref:hypothetical protein n=1 Tax=Pseudomonas sp. KBS0710 TaxID=1179667 RepID=UPI00110EF852|nr:hypothetical protein [Pseudomonas sp. KBS0710]TSD78820.1 hypothetical protein FFI16_021105 [Pseudomonas sp. KBS0710]